MSSSPPVAPTDRAANEEFPEDPRFRVMRRLVTFLLIVMIAGTLAVVIALVLKLKSTSFTSNAPSEVSIGLAADERLVGAAATAERITLTIERASSGERRLVILDARDYRVLSAISAKAPATE